MSVFHLFYLSLDQLILAYFGKMLSRCMLLHVQYVSVCT